MTVKGLRQFLDEQQQRAWRDGESALQDGERSDFHETLEQRFKYSDRFEKLLQRPRAQDVLDILRLYAESCIPIPRATERFYWSVSCLASSPDKPLARVNASWMELFTLLPDRPSPLLGEGASRSEVGEGPAASAAEQTPLPASSSLRARIILHLADFTTDGSPEPDHLDTALLEACARGADNLDYAIWRNGRDILIARVRTAASIRAFLGHPHALRAIRRFNLTHMNRGRNAYQASHCYSLADAMLDELPPSATTPA